MRMKGLKKVIIPVFCLQLGLAPSIYSWGTAYSNIPYLIIGSFFGLSVGALSGKLFISTSESSEKKKKAKEEIALYMKRNHLSLVRDIALARGPMITGWAADLKLSSSEQDRLENRLEGSKEQLELLETLSGEIDLNDAEVFSRSLVSVLVDIVDEERLMNLEPASF